MTTTKILKNPLLKKALDNFIPLKDSRYNLHNQIGSQIIHKIQQYLNKNVDKKSK